jgi:hypothetical protein
MANRRPHHGRYLHRAVRPLRGLPRRWRDLELADETSFRMGRLVRANCRGDACVALWARRSESKTRVTVLMPSPLQNVQLLGAML